MKKSILIPTDFSENAWSALNYALKFYAGEECTFYLLNSYYFSNAHSRTFITSHFIATLKEASQRDLVALKNKIEKQNTNTAHSFEIIMSSDELSYAIKHSIEKYSIDTVVMGTKGASGIDKFFFGSNTVKTIQNIKSCPVLAVPDNMAFVAPRQIAFATDFNRPYVKAVLDKLLALINLHDAHLNVVHINVEKTLSDVQQKNVNELKEFLKDNKHSFHWMPAYSTKSEIINDFIKEMNIDMLAMFNYRHSIIENMTKEPIIKKIGYHPIIPFLIIPANN
ncbi:nucleotide-binding universal stress UspA family protein [Gelidibacter sediminis]|uniref:Nucleotide-binding universal stress UspA family protein n=1 Tax=Gelidibacter sediminis TaxID=1608710 RepID=A0A4R7PX18_9FLAO|nr:universal stress protein [Gelidibacter sediminis]TDU39468.1 nucleotide-binding universal stress UspA family protein [Gelidibacter sediminis]